MDRLTAEQMIGRFLYGISSRLVFTQEPDCIEDSCPAILYAEWAGYRCRILSAEGIAYPWEDSADIPDDVTPWCPRYLTPFVLFDNTAKLAAEAPPSTDREQLDETMKMAIRPRPHGIFICQDTTYIVEDDLENDSPEVLHDPKDERSI